MKSAVESVGDAETTATTVPAAYENRLGDDGRRPGICLTVLVQSFVPDGSKRACPTLYHSVTETCPALPGTARHCSILGDLRIGQTWPASLESVGPG